MPNLLIMLCKHYMPGTPEQIFAMPDLYSDLTNNRAANLVLLWKKITYTLLLRPTRLLISEIFPSKPDFHLHK